MANLWLRLYHDMPNDPKWRTIARVSNQPIPLVLAVYVHLLVIASQATDRGAVVNINTEDIASALDADSVAIDAVVVAMQNRVIENDRLSGWDKRQVAREDGAAERAKQWRERKRTQTNANERQIKTREEEIKTKTSTKTNATTGAKAPLFVLPAWIDRKAWDGFEAMRVKMRRGLTEQGRSLCMKKLESLQRAGNDPTQVLNQSTMNGWQGLFEIKGNNNAKPSRSEQIRDSSIEALAILGRMDHAANSPGAIGEAGRPERRLLEGVHGSAVAPHG